MDAWHQTHLLIWTPEGGGYPQQWAVMAVQDPKVPGQWRAMRREDWPGEKARWEFNLATRRYSLRSALTIEHPTKETITAAVLQRYSFLPQRVLYHMRWESV